MAVELFAENLATTTVSSGGTDAPAQGTVESWTVTSSAMFPVAVTGSSQFHVADATAGENSEMILVTNVSGTTWTVTRGAEGTTPIAHTAGFTIYQVTTTGALTQLRSTDWFNVVTQFGADPTGATDSTTAIQNALAAAAASESSDNPLGGGTVYLPWGVYLISGSLNIPPQTYLVGQGNITLPIAAFDVQYGGARLYASSSWAPASTTGVVQFLSKTPGGWSKNMEQSGMKNIVIDCSANTSTNLSGILNTGPVYDIHLQDVFINTAGHNGIHSASHSESGIGPSLPYHHYYERVTCYNCVNTGFNVANFTDSTFSQCMSFGAGGSGWVLAGMQDSIFTACRSQWSTANGFILTATGGHLIFTGCETDNNGQSGLVINSTSGTGGAITVSGWISECDGRASSAAALYIHGCATPVVIDGFTQGMDSVSGTGAPVYGLQVASNTAPVTITGSYFEGSTAAILNGGSNTALTMSNVTAGTGTIGSLVYENIDTTDWLNVVWFGADPTGTNDSTSAINNALSAAPLGGTVYLPAGTYQTTAPLVIPPQVTLRGPGSWHLDTSTCEILPSSGFSGAAIILMYDQSTGGYSVVSSSQAILNLILNGTNLTGSIDGIQSQGYVHGVIIQDVQIYKAPAHGIACVSNSSGVAYSWRGTRVSANTCGTHGFSLSITDCTWYDLEAIGCTQNGFNLSGSPSNSHFDSCRAEYNSIGFALSGAWASGGGSGGVLFTGCSTDGNVEDGVRLAATGTVPVTFNGLMCRRDGANGLSGGGGYGGVRAVGNTLPTQINGLSVFPGIAQTGGANSPEYGIAFTSSSANISVGSAVIYAATTPWRDDGTNTNITRGPNILEYTGTTSSATQALNALQVTDKDVTFQNPSTGLTTDLLAPGGSWLPSDSGWAAWNYDPAYVASSQVPSSGAIWAMRINIRVPSTVITNVILYQATPGSALTSSECYAGLYSSTGTQVGITADQSSAWTTGTAVFKTMALAGGPYTISSGFYWVTAVSNGTTNPAWGRFQSQSATVANPGVSASGARWATAATGGQTTLPTSFTPASYFNIAQLEYWAGLS